MIPIGDSNPTTRLPIVTRLLLFVNIAAWLYVVSLGRAPGAAEAFYDRYAFDWGRFTTAITTGQVDAFTFIPLFTHMFLHGGWLHIIGNMLYLWVFGDNVEDRLGSARYLLFYLLAGIAAAVGQGLVAPSPMVGASGAIAGVLGAYLVLFPTARVRTLVFLGIFITVLQLPALVVIGLFIVIQLIEGLAELRIAAHPAAAHIAYYAHIFGFVAGILLLFLFRRGRSPRHARYG
ncbi:MAG TPA: rhomboid family intramembrane serine protease [Candidatus Saccharimonadales bacterium]|nr:rhomboid family intramembrane serine protease [Candidatus Saccharimonadales bacterium]